MCSRLSHSCHLKSFDIIIMKAHPTESTAVQTLTNARDLSTAPRLTFTNCEKIHLMIYQIEQHPVIWEISNQCKYLSLDNDCTIDVNKTDLSGIETLTLDAVEFKLMQSNQDIINLSRQCTNIQDITFTNPTVDMLTFWKGINNYLMKNSAKVHLQVSRVHQMETKYNIFQLVRKNNLQI